jgi:GT2 family glycosyltransferase
MMRAVREAMTPDLVNVILVSYNSARYVDVVFPALAAQTYAPVRILVIDNGSRDGTLAAIRSRYPFVQTLALGENAGFSRALNRGIRDTDGEFVMSLNLDVTLEPRFIAALVAALRERPDAGWAAGSLSRLTADGPTDEIDCNGHYLLSSRCVYGYDPDRPQPAAYTAVREVFGASGCAALYRRSLLDDVAVEGEIFDEDFFAFYEDVDFDWRAQRRGHTCLFVPEARGAHARMGALTTDRPDVAALLVSNRLLTILKNDDVRDVARDWSPILRRTLVDVGLQWKRTPRSIPMAMGRVLRLLPRMLAKRRRLRRNRRPGPTPVQRFRLPTRFLG